MVAQCVKKMLGGCDYCSGCGGCRGSGSCEGCSCRGYCCETSRQGQGQKLGMSNVAVAAAEAGERERSSRASFDSVSSAGLAAKCTEAGRAACREQGVARQSRPRRGARALLATCCWGESRREATILDRSYRPPRPAR